MPSSMGPVQLIPPGLLGLLQLKSQGRNPQTLSDEYLPMIEMRDWLFQQNIIEVSGRTAGLSNGSVGYVDWSSPVRVDQNTIWWVHDYAVEATLAATTDVVQFVPAIQGFDTAAWFAHGTRVPLIAGTAAGRRPTAYAGGFFLPPGWKLGFVAEVNETATAVAYTGCLRVTSFLI